MSTSKPILSVGTVLVGRESYAGCSSSLIFGVVKTMTHAGLYHIELIGMDRMTLPKNNNKNNNDTLSSWTLVMSKDDHATGAIVPMTLFESDIENDSAPEWYMQSKDILWELYAPSETAHGIQH